MLIFYYFCNMKKLLILSAVALFLFACSEEKGKPVHIAGLRFDTLTIDTSAVLLGDTVSPTCSVSIALQVARGKGAEAINRAILNSGILLPGYVNTDSVALTPEQYLDSFVCRYIGQYKRDYAPLYLDDTENADSYENSFTLKTSTMTACEGIIAYVADIDFFGGGTHNTRQTVVRNIEVRTGKVLTLTDIFRHGYEQTLQQELLKKLCRKFHAADADGLARKQVLVDGNIYIPDNFILFKKKIQFIYNPAEIAPYDMGEIRLDIDKSSLKGLLQETF